MWRRWVKFGLVGVLNTAINYGVFALLLAAGLYYLLAAVTGFLSGVTTSYAINRRWTFACRTPANVTEAWRFLLVNLTALGVFTGAAALGVEQFHVTPRLAWVLAIGCSFTVNFVGSQWWAFQEAPA